MIKKIKKVTAVLLILCGAAGAVARVNYTHKLKGRITYMNSGNRPVINAQVEARDGAHADRTDNRGYFTLVFYRKEAGVDVQLRVRKGKLVVVNEKELAVTLKKDQEKEIKLYMCQKTELDRLRLNYYNISIANITKRYREETERLRRENKLSMEAIDRLEREKENLVAQAEELADKFARVNFDDISALRREAFEYFKAGNIKKAIDTLKFETLSENIDKAEEEFSRGEKMEKEGRERKEKALEQKRQGIGGLLDKARWCRLDFQFELAKKCYEAAVKKDPGDYDTIAELASFLYDQNQFIEARPYYEKLLSLADTEAKRAAVLNNVGNLYSDNNQLTEALHAYSEALKIYKQLAEKNPGAFLSDVAMTQNNLGILYLYQNQLEKALEILSQAAATRVQLTAMNPRAFEIDLCSTLIVLARFVHLQLLLKSNDITHLEKADSLISDAINRLKKYPKVPRAAGYLKDARSFKKIIDEAKEMLEKIPADKYK